MSYPTISRVSAEIRGTDPNPLSTFNRELRGGIIELPFQQTRLPMVSIERPLNYYSEINIISPPQKGYQQGRGLFFDWERVRSENSRKVIGTIQPYKVNELKDIVKRLNIKPLATNKEGYVRAINNWLKENGYQTAE